MNFTAFFPLTLLSPHTLSPPPPPPLPSCSGRVAMEDEDEAGPLLPQDEEQ